MGKYLLSLALVALLTACSDSSDSGSDTGGNTGGGTTDSGNTDNGNTGGGNNQAGGLPGVWFGNNDFGNGVMVIDAANNIYSLSANTQGRYETVFGPVSGTLERYIHRDSLIAGQSFTLAGDYPSERPAEENAGPDTTSYSLSVINDGQQVQNSGGAANFSMTFATADDVQTISVSEVAGSWGAMTNFGPTFDLELSFDINADGSVTGATIYQDGAPNNLTGTVTEPANANQYLTVSFEWLGNARNGVIYKHRDNPSQLILNTVGPDNDGNKSFSALMTRQ